MPFVTLARTVTPITAPSISLFASPGDELLEFGSNNGTTVEVLDEDGDVVVPAFTPDIFLTSPTLLSNGDILGISNTAVVRYNPAGTIIDQSTGFTPGAGRTTELANGNILVTFDDAGGNLRGQLLTPTLDLIGSNFSIATSSTSASQIVALTGGGFAVLADKTGSSDVTQTFDANGVAVGSVTPAGGFYRSEIQALSDGSYVLVGTELISFLGGVAYQSRMRIYNADGTARSPSYISLSNVVESVHVAALDDGLMVISRDGANSQLFDVYGHALGDPLGTPAFAMQGGMEGIDADTFVSIGKATPGGPTQLFYWSVDRANILLGDGTGETFSGAGATDRIMVGYGGDDTYNVDSAGDIVHEWTGEGNDTVNASVSYQLRAGADVELLQTSDEAGTAAINLAGNALVQAIRGNAGANWLTSGGGADTLTGLAGNDFYFLSNGAEVVQEAAGAGSDRIFTSASYTLAAGVSVETMSTHLNTSTTSINLTGNELVQAIYGNDGTNQLNGGGGADTLAGFGGNDSYVIVDGQERVVEAANGGSDRVFTAVDYTLRAGSSVETLSTDLDAGTAALHLTGNELAQTIRGNAGANWLTGGGGGDIMVGLDGNDFYFVNDSRDLTLENSGSGTDRIFASVSYTISAGQSIEMLTTNNNAGTDAINFSGDFQVQTIFGNAGTNQLYSGGGADTLVGLGGNDFYYVVDGHEQVIESAGGGADRIFASVDYALRAGSEVEQISTNLNTATTAIDITGNELAQTIFGNAGVNILDGGAGKDILVGLGGADTFLFSTALNTAPGTAFAALAATANVDRIDGMAADDRIGLDSGIFGLPEGALNANAFVVGTAAQDADDRIIYNQATGALMFDADGTGAQAAQLFGYVNAPISLDASFFVVV